MRRLWCFASIGAFLCAHDDEQGADGECVVGLRGAGNDAKHVLTSPASYTKPCSLSDHPKLNQTTPTFPQKTL